VRNRDPANARAACKLVAGWHGTNIGNSGEHVHFIEDSQISAPHPVKGHRAREDAAAAAYKPMLYGNYDPSVAAGDTAAASGQSHVGIHV
jgi:hypothetical protein